MKNLSILLALLILSSCDNELNVLEEPKDIPVVYGFLSLSTEDQYIRVERAFVDENTSALELAQDANNLYYPETATVTITDLTTQEEFLLDRVDGSQLGILREDGLFATEPNILYRLSRTQTELQADHLYQFTLNRGDGLPLVTDTTELVSNIRFISPNPLQSTPTIDFKFLNSTDIKWREGTNAAIYDVVMDFNYQERTNNSSFVDKSVRWEIAELLTINEFSPSGIDFYNFLLSEIGVDENVTRRFVDIDMTVVGGNQDLFEYLTIANANLGITSTQDVPFYQDLSEGRGIFGSKFTATLSGVKLSPGSQDSLVNGTITAPLNF